MKSHGLRNFLFSLRTKRVCISIWPLVGMMAMLFSGVANAAITINSQTAIGITSTGVTALQGNVTSNSGISYVTQFEYGPTAGYGTTIAGSPNITAGTLTTSSAAITGLTCGTVYHFRLNILGATSGADTTFTTSACPAPAPVPTLSEWAMITFAMLIVGFGVYQQRRRQL